MVIPIRIWLNIILLVVSHISYNNSLGNKSLQETAAKVVGVQFLVVRHLIIDNTKTHFMELSEVEDICQT